MVGFGFGLGLGFSNPSAAVQQHPHEDEICAAIAAKSVVRFAFEGAEYLAEPYAVYDQDQGGKALRAVVLRTSNASHNSWTPQDFPLSKISGWAQAGATFIPSLAFDPAILGDRIICSVDLG